MDYYIGIDQSLTSTGICVLHGEPIDQLEKAMDIGKKEGKSNSYVLMLQAIRPNTTGTSRLVCYRKELEKIFRQCEPYSRHSKAYLALERPAISHGEGAGHSGGVQFYLGTIFGVIILVWRDITGTEPYLIPASSVKLFATGKGTSGKSQLIKHAYIEYGIDITGPGSDDKADALFIAKMLYHLKNPENLPAKEYMKRALSQIKEETVHTWQ